MAADLGVGLHLGVHEFFLRVLLAGTLAVRQGHGAERRDDEQRSGQLHGQDVVAEDRLRDRLGVRRLVRPFHSNRVRCGSAQDRATEDDGEAQTAQDGDRTLRPQRLMGGIGGVDADHHEHEEEHHEDGAGVDGHLDDAHEGRLEHRVQEGQADHVRDDARGRVHGAAGDEQAVDGQDDHDGRKAEEEHRLPHGNL